MDVLVTRRPLDVGPLSWRDALIASVFGVDERNTAWGLDRPPVLEDGS